MNNNEIISMASNSIYSEFGESYEIYKEEVPQDIATPSFFIYTISTNLAKAPNNRRNRSLSIAIKYFTDKEDENNKDMYEVSERLFKATEKMTYNDCFARAKNVEYSLKEGVLHFNFNLENLTFNKEENVLFGGLEVETIASK